MSARGMTNTELKRWWISRPMSEAIAVRDEVQRRADIWQINEQRYRRQYERRGKGRK